MTEGEWLALGDPDALLEFLRREAYGRRRPTPSRRKLRLFACACCRRAWSSIPDERSRRAVEVAERYADRRATRQDLALAFAAARAVTGLGNGRFAAATASSPSGNADRTARQAALAGDMRLWAAERAAQADLVRDIFGNAFAPVPALDPEWRSRNGGAVLALARSICDDRAFGRLPLLAEMLEEAGRASPALLAHLRAPGPHVRGCWPLDLILARE